jgi:hypothetical protein
MKIRRDVEARSYAGPFRKFGFRQRLSKPRRCQTRLLKTIAKKALRG